MTAPTNTDTETTPSRAGVVSDACSPKAWRSCAEWPEGVLSIYDREGNITTDQHDEKDVAEGICNLLSIFGLGADGKIFPVRTWIEEIHAENID